MGEEESEESCVWLKFESCKMFGGRNKQDFSRRIDTTTRTSTTTKSARMSGGKKGNLLIYLIAILQVFLLFQIQVCLSSKTTTTSLTFESEARTRRSEAPQLEDGWQFGVTTGPTKSRQRQRRATSMGTNPAKKQAHQHAVRAHAQPRQQAAGSQTEVGASSPANSGPDSQQSPSGARTIKNVTAQNGQSVLLHCLVEPNGNGEIPSVSWFRGTGELQLLTYDQSTIIQDERFVIRHGIQRENDWALQIKNLDKSSDAGLYQCQTTSGTDSPQSQFYQLNIVEPQVSILGAPDLAVKLGSLINLTCVISHTADQLQFIFWYRNERMINYDISNEKRGKIVMSKWHNSTGKTALAQDTITSNLQIYSSRLSDSGNYTCQPSGARSASVYLHVLEAHDRRLIMFQNDDQSINLSEQSASSQQQTNSAISLQLHRFDRGKIYGIFIAFVIFSTWFNLVAQVQTGISLFLLAIIGYFLGLVTGPEHNSSSRNNGGQSGEPPNGLAGSRLNGGPQIMFANGKFDNEEEKLGNRNKKKKKKPHKGQDHEHSESKRNESEKNNDEEDDEDHSRKQLLEDPLLERANDALNLLRSINNCNESANEHSTTCSVVESVQMIDLDDQQQVGGLLRNESLRKQFYSKTKLTTRLDKSPSSSSSRQASEQPSPSASSSSSSSTGYNSDSRESNPRGAAVNVELVQLLCDNSASLVLRPAVVTAHPTTSGQFDQPEVADKRTGGGVVDSSARRVVLDKLCLSDCRTSGSSILGLELARSKLSEEQERQLEKLNQTPVVVVGVAHNHTSDSENLNEHHSGSTCSEKLEAKE